MKLPLYEDNGEISRALSQEALDKLAEFKKEYQNEKSFVENPCLCGSNDFVIISKRDKYGLALNYKLCRSCSLMRIDPYYSPEVLDHLYSDIYRIVKDYSPETLFEKQIGRGEDLNNYLKERLDISGYEQVIEIGTGAGGILVPFKEEGKKVVGFDFDQDYLTIGKEKGLDVRCEDALDSLAELTKQKTSIVIINHVLEHIVEAKEFINKLENTVATGTLVYIAVPGTFSYVKKFFPRQLIKYFVFAHPWNFTLHSIKQNLLQNRTFEIVSEDDEIRLILRKTEKKHTFQGINPAESMIKDSQQLKRKEDLYKLRSKAAKIKNSIKSVFMNN